jgi:hypothetical protein
MKNINKLIKSNKATGLRWGLSMTSYQGGAGLQRFIIQYD